MPNPEGFTDALEDACARRCAEVGDPPFWQMPELCEPCEHVTPCDDCLAEVATKDSEA